MPDKIIVVSDLGQGDGGKGSIIHFLISQERPDAIIKFGGGQGSHGVVLEDGRKFAFSHFGCGTLEGIPTLMAPSFVAIPHALVYEANLLKRNFGISNPYQLLTIDPRVVMTTPYHALYSRILELSRKDNAKGTIGTGVGAAYRIYQKHGRHWSLTMRDFRNENLARDKILANRLARIQGFLFGKIEHFSEDDFLKEDRETFKYLRSMFQSDGLFTMTMQEYEELINAEVECRELSEAAFEWETKGTMIAESSHGVLSDAETGYKPYVSSLRTLPQIIKTTLRREGFTGKFETVGVTRAYAMRHGAGPLPTESPKMLEALFPDVNDRHETRYVGKLKVGPLDFDQLRFAVNNAGGADKFAGVAVTCADQIWELNGDPLETKERFALDLRTRFERELGLEVKIVSFGPKDSDKVFMEG